MDEQEKSRILQGIIQLCACFAAPAPAERLDSYVKALSDYEFMPVAKAIHALMSSHKPKYAGHIPSPAEILESAGITGRANSDQAWQLVRKTLTAKGRYISPIFEDREITAALRSAGGWTRLCNCSEKELEWFKKRFDAAYQEYKCKDLDPAMYESLQGDRGAELMLVSSEGTTKALPKPSLPPEIKQLIAGVTDEQP